jgi:hypothetical protein
MLDVDSVATVKRVTLNRSFLYMQCHVLHLIVAVMHALEIRLSVSHYSIVPFAAPMCCTASTTTTRNSVVHACTVTASAPFTVRKTTLSLALYSSTDQMICAFRIRLCIYTYAGASNQQLDTMAIRVNNLLVALIHSRSDPLLQAQELLVYHLQLFCDRPSRTVLHPAAVLSSARVRTVVCANSQWHR